MTARLYVVGGAVRDALLGRAASDRDWVAVGATPEEMVAAGYRPVGKDFPVFIDPRNGEEVALARTERKSAPGYHGFSFHADPAVTLEQDLARRDLTINAIAQAEDGRLIDPYGGRRDLEQQVLRHVSPAFVEDPVRLLRLARFAARLPHFSIAAETQALLAALVESGEVDALVPERVWQELSRGLMEGKPSRMFEVLRGCGALARLLPEVDRLWGVPQPPEHHPEVDTGAHLLLVLDQAAALGAP
ncbi:MAG: multifunctional CCA tRNA nucleotidyl transferase/2'3'-cyclic phosphodiesterase/2'nucleotidase/phosphatase, partial [Burkholderiales bacterium]|nr:multifunctional CCA tRNA nucleotidyl transferase/2'3'-cyclic phosphodiesterase/2'nucleotidase/phosphatase [Burkholderiales bacterium]